MLFNVILPEGPMIGYKKKIFYSILYSKAIFLGRIKGSKLVEFSQNLLWMEANRVIKGTKKESSFLGRYGVGTKYPCFFVKTEFYRSYTIVSLFTLSHVF